ncbi:hypothetical protein [Weissella paramesenteroides]|jgi:membrane-associated HD superfamily phosphohydrolase|uniref:hypothetical protein n=1 Tax=Weissella paramesenteroides TaxID=1249 RepID=UPI002E7AF33F|nr:hypothetical protein [Weissella paramesenteroides]WPQ68023.1 hypothetical protein QRX23_09810 [Weissella paramesenteroides]
MVDWKYGAYISISWLIILSIFAIAKGLTNNFGWYFLASCLAILIVLVASYFYEHKHPQFKDKNRLATIRYFRVFWVLLIFIIYLIVALTASHFSDLFFLICLSLGQTIPSFFTKYKRN